MNAASSEPSLLSPHSLVDPPGPDRGPPRAGKGPDTLAPIREILACVDGSGFGGGVVPHAQLVARALGARLTLLRVLETESAGAPPADPLDWEIRRREARAHLDDLATQLRDPESDVRSELIQGLPAEQICGWAEQHGIDLTVLCSHGARGVTQWDLASTARKLIERVPGSLLLVPAVAAIKRGKARYARILVPLDGSPRAESVVPIARRIAASQNAELLFGHVVPAPEITRIGPLDAEGAELERRVIEHNGRVASAYLDRLRAHTSRAGTRVRAVVIGGGPPETGLDRLIREEQVDLVVMSAHGRTGRTDSPCGSVTEYILTHATTPLLVVRDRAVRRSRRVGSSSTRPPERLAPSTSTTL